MARVKRGVTSRRKHHKLLGLAKGYRGSRSRSIKRAHESVLHSGEYAFKGRKMRKRDFRRLWITRISESTKQLGMPYKDLIHNLKDKNILLNRKMIADLVVNDFNTFKKLVEQVKA